MAINTKTALFHFDKFYPYIYSINKWRSIRLGLLCNPKKMFLINNSYCQKDNLISNLQKNGAIDFLENLEIKEKTIDSSHEYLYLKHDTITKGTQLDEFVKSKEYIGDRDIYTKNIGDSFTNYTSSASSEKLSATFHEEKIAIKSEALSYEKINFPTSLKVLAYPKGVVKKPYPVPIDEFNQSGFYPIDGFSILVVLLMNIKKSDKILDMCAAPGGKAVAMLQTELPDELVCIDESHSRIERLKIVMKTHLSLDDVDRKLSIIHGNSIEQTEYMKNYFDKVLVDVPCSTDRHAINKSGLSLFANDNYNKRMKLYSTQHRLLRRAIESCKIGGDIVYSTCTLSPVQNEKVVSSVMKIMNSEATDFQLKIVPCESEFYNTHKKYSSKTSEIKSKNDWFSSFDSVDSIGQLILPTVINNYGPGYICKIRKVPKEHLNK